MSEEDGDIVTAEHFESIVAALRSVTPFRVFTIELHGGRRCEVDHPDALSFHDGVAFFLAPGGVPVLFDHDSVNQVIHALANTGL